MIPATSPLRAPLLCTLVALGALAAEGQSNEAGIFVSGSRIPLSTTLHDPQSGVTAVFTLDENPGAGISYTRFWTRHLATEVALQQADSTVRADLGVDGFGLTLGVGTLEVTALSALAQWHWRRDAAISPWIGAGLAALEGDLRVPREVAEITELEETELGRVASWIVDGGLSFRIAERIRVAVDVKYTRYQPERTTPVFREGDAIHPLFFGAGLRLRF